MFSFSKISTETDSATLTNKQLNNLVAIYLLLDIFYFLLPVDGQKRRKIKENKQVLVETFPLLVTWLIRK